MFRDLLPFIALVSTLLATVPSDAAFGQSTTSWTETAPGQERDDKCCQHILSPGTCKLKNFGINYNPRPVCVPTDGALGAWLIYTPASYPADCSLRVQFADSLQCGHKEDGEPCTAVRTLFLDYSCPAPD